MNCKCHKESDLTSYTGKNVKVNFLTASFQGREVISMCLYTLAKFDLEIDLDPFNDLDINTVIIML